MRLHEMTHSGEKPHKCSQCDFSSITTSHMTIHMRSAHTGEKPFNCDQCLAMHLQQTNGFATFRYLKPPPTNGLTKSFFFRASMRFVRIIENIKITPGSVYSI